MIYLSRLVLNPYNRGSLYDMSDPYELHRTVMRGFGNVDGTQPGRVLFRLDESRQNPPIVYVQSLIHPDWSFLLQRKNYLADAPDDRGNPAVRQWEPRFDEGQVFRFRLRANPSRRDNQTRKRFGLFAEEDQRAWLIRKGEQNGFRTNVDGLVTVPEGLIAAGRRNKNGTTITTYGVRFDGLLEVTSADRFTAALRAGIGPSKGLGFGLLSLASA